MYLYLFTSTWWKFICTVCSTGIIWSYFYFIYDSWEVYGGHVGTTCGIIHRYNSMVFDGSRKKRKICSPLFDSRKAGNLRFYFALGRCSQGISLRNT